MGVSLSQPTTKWCGSCSSLLNSFVNKIQWWNQLWGIIFSMNCELTSLMLTVIWHIWHDFPYLIVYMLKCDVRAAALLRPHNLLAINQIENKPNMESFMTVSMPNSNLIFIHSITTWWKILLHPPFEWFYTIFGISHLE